MRRSSTQRIDGICRLYQLEKEGVYKQGKFILEVYQDLCWKTVRNVDCVREDLAYYCSSDVDKALIYLETFAPDERREYFESRIQTLFTNHMMAAMIDEAVAKVCEYPDDGKLYYDILSMSYLYRNSMRESEILEVLGIERSTYYKRKKEAVILFGVAMLDAIHNRKAEIRKNITEAETLPSGVTGELPFL